MERLRRIELPSGAWKALILPLNYSRIIHGGDNENRTRVQTFSLRLYTPVEPFYPHYNGASGWIRTNNVCPEGLVLQTSATPPSLPPMLIKLKWWRMWGSNPRPLPCKGSALPAELIPHYYGRDGLTRTDDFSVPSGEPYH